MSALKLYLAIFVSSLLFSGCVSNSTYKKLETKHKMSQEELAATRSSLIEAKYLLAKTANKRRIQHEKAQSLAKELDEMKSQEENYKLRLEVMKAEQENLKDSLERAKYIAAMAREVTAQRERVLRAYLEKLQTLFSSSELDISIVGGRLLVSMPSDVIFPSGSDKLSDKGQETVKSISAVLAYGSQNQFQIEGHTDTDPIKGGQFKTNWHLGYARAMSVLKVFVSEGVSESLISAASFGQHRPRASNETSEGKALNRRIEIVMIPDLSVLAEGLDAVEE